MPELPEVETTRRGILPHLLNKRVASVVVRQKKLRWPITPALQEDLPGQLINSITRRGKYLLLASSDGTLIIHLGMSGSLRIVSQQQAAGKHDHVDIIFKNHKILRYTDPRRFGCLLWHRGDITTHPLLKALGPEPLEEQFDGDHLATRSRKRSTSIKSFIMDSRNVVGVGNIYANEALFLAGISPKRAAGKISVERYRVLAQSIKQVLFSAIQMGGTTLRDFTDSNGEPGYFKQSLSVYSRGGLPCVTCQELLKEIRLGQRSTVYCSNCQR